MCGVVASSNQHNLVGLGKRCRHLCCNLGKSLKHKRENGGISVLLVGACLHPHPLCLGPANCLSCSRLSSTDQADLLTISSGGFNSFSPLTLSNCLHFVSFGLCWEFDRGYQLLLLPLDLLLLDLDLLPPLSTLRFNPLHPMAVTCTAHSEAFTKVASSRPLTVQLRRKVEEEEVKLREGGSVRLQLPENKGPYKWLLNDREVPGETGNFLDIEDFTTDYHNSVVKCIQEKFGGEARLLKVVRLVHDTSPDNRKPRSREYSLQDDQPASNNQGGKALREVFTCVREDDEGVGAPEYIWVDGALQTRTRIAKDQDGNAIRCSLVKDGFRKVKLMEKKMKAMAKDLRRFFKTLRQFNT